MGHHILVMGVAGCGKTSIAQAVASALGYEFIEGDLHHPATNLEKMRAGVALNDADRQPWLEHLGSLLKLAPTGAVLACSALKRSYRDQLRSQVADLRTVYIAIEEALSRQRVASRAAHVFPVSLVASQFADLQEPQGEDKVLVLKAETPLSTQVEQVLHWLGQAAEPPVMAN